MKKLRKAFHPNMQNDGDSWLVCHVLLGCISYKPGDLTAPMPSEYSSLSEDEYEIIDEKQIEYVKKVLQWIDKKKVVKSFFDVYFQESSNLTLKKLGVSSDLKDEGAWFPWSYQAAETIVDSATSLRNLYVEAEDGSKVIIYEDINNVFVLDPHKTLPDRLTRPWK